MMPPVAANQQAMAAQPQQGNPNVQQIQEPQLGDITGDPALDEALAAVMQTLPKGADQVMSNLLAALQPYLTEPGTEQAQGNPMEQGV